MFILFIIIALVLSSIIFFAKNGTVTIISLVIFSFSLVAINIYAYFHLNEINNIYYKFDALSVILATVLSILSIATFYHSYLYLNRKNSSPKQKAVYFSSLIMFITAMNSAYFAENIALLWVSVEASSLLVSILIYHIRSKDALEATWKYLFVSSVGLAIAFMGILFLGIIASNNGVTDLSFHKLLSVANQMDSTWIKIAFVLFVTGLSVKMNIFPLYAVAVDAKTIMASPINALMSTTLVNVGFVGIYKFYAIISQTSAIHWAQNVLMIIGVSSIFIASIQLSRVKRLKRMFAFSSMEHMGIVLLGLSMGGIGYYAAILHIIFHSFVKASLFYQLGAIRQFYKSVWIKDAANYFKLNPIGGLALILGLVSILAIPPSGLFISEFLIFKAMFISGHIYIAIIVLILLSIIIYIFIKKSFYLLYNDNPQSIITKNIKVNPYENISQFVLLGLVIYLGINPPVYFTDLINAAVAILN